MIGSTKLGTIRTEVRRAFKLSDAELLAWFNEQMQTLAQQPKVNQVEIDTLRLLRDALVKEAAKRPSRQGRLRPSRRSKATK